MTTSTAQINSTVEELSSRIVQLEQKIESLSKKSTNASQRDMTDEDALKILTGEHKDLKHNDVAQKLGLSYGQVYSCRGAYTFKHIHKALEAQGFKNQWKSSK